LVRVAVAWLALAIMLAPGTTLAQTVEARVDRQRIAVGESTTLRVTVRGASGAKAPEFDTPPGLQLLNSSRQQSFAWVNGRASLETEFRYDLEGLEVGRYAIGPIVVTVGSQAYRSGEIALEVSEAPHLSQGGREAPATLRVEVQPRDPYVGQECTLRVRLIQHTSFAEDPQYTPPTTTGFWTDRATAPESYYADEKGERVLVTETRTRLYPLAIGPATVGDASAVVVIAGGGSDPFSLYGGDHRELVLRSPPVAVSVRALPPGAPPGFGGGVGRYETAWSADRSETPRDVPVTLRLDVRGRGNLPLVRAPQLSNPDIEILASGVEDSLPTPGSEGPGRKRFQWTVMAKREGKIEVPPPAFAWFEPTGGVYRAAGAAAVKVEVGPATQASGANPEATFPRALADRPVEPGSRAPIPWGFAIAGLALGGAFRSWSSARRRPPMRQDAHAWQVRLRAAVGADLWKAAQDACSWLEAQGLASDEVRWRDLGRRIAAARYGGAVDDEETVRRELLARVKRLDSGGSRFPARVYSVALVLVAAGSLVGFGPHPGNARAAMQCRAADQAARQGDIAKARDVWQALWQSWGGHPGLAARLAWAHNQAGEVGPAALWVLRGELVEARDPSLRWIEERVREAGGLVGAAAPRWPVRSIEWSIAALILATGGVVAWGRRGLAVSCLVGALGVSAIEPVQGWRASRSGEAVVLTAAALQGSDVELEPGQLVIVRGREGSRVRVTAGRVIEGWIPASAVARVAKSEVDG
jgi:hypothetical protein